MLQCGADALASDEADSKVGNAVLDLHEEAQQGDAKVTGRVGVDPVVGLDNDVWQSHKKGSRRARRDSYILPPPSV